MLRIELLFEECIYLRFESISKETKALYTFMISITSVEDPQGWEERVLSFHGSERIGALGIRLFL